MNKLLKRIDSNYTRDLVEKAKQYKFYLGGFLLLLFFIIGFKLFIEEQLKPVWKPVAPNVVFALHFENEAKDTLLQEQMVKIIDENIFTTWDIFLASIPQKKEVKPKETVVSMHTAFSTNPELLYNWYLEKNEFNTLLKAIKQQGAMKSRQYREKTIFEISATKTTFHFYLQNQVLTASTSALLLEASLRAITDSEYAVNPEVANQLNGEGMGLLLNNKALTHGLNNLVGFPSDFFTAQPNQFIALALTVDKDGIRANSMDNVDFVSSGDNIILQKNILFYSQQLLNKEVVSEEKSQRLALLQERFGFEIKKFKTGIAAEYARFTLKSESVQQPYQVLVIPVLDSMAIVTELAKLHPQAPIRNSQFNQIKQPDFPSFLLSQKLENFPNTFYLINEGKLWLSNFSLPVKIIKDLQEVAFTENAYSIYFNKSLKFYVNSKLDDFGKRLFNQINHVSLIAKLDTVNIHVQLNGKERLVKKLDTLFSTPLKRKIGKPIFPVQNHYTQAPEFLWQDSKTRLHLMTDSGEILWEKPVWYYAKSKISQVDIYNNGKLQYAFASDGRLHAYDRLGRTVNGFPIALPTYFEADFLLPLRWKNDKEQRFLIAGSLPDNAASSGGKLYLYNRYGGIARGWRPRNVEAPLACTPQLITHQGRDVILALLSNGSFYALEKSGRMLQGFPLITNLMCNSQFVLDKTRHINFISEGGTLIKLDLEGNLISREQIGQRTGNTTFQLIENEWQKGDFLIATQRGKELILQDASIKTLFSYPLATTETHQFAYYSDGFSKTAIVAFSPKREKCILLTKQGKKLISGEIESEIMPVLSKDSQNGWHLLVSQRDKLIQLSN